MAVRHIRIAGCCCEFITTVSVNHSGRRLILGEYRSPTRSGGGYAKDVAALLHEFTVSVNSAAFGEVAHDVPMQAAAVLVDGLGGGHQAVVGSRRAGTSQYEY